MKLSIARSADELTDGLAGQRALIVGAEHGVGPAVVAALRKAGTRLAVDSGEAIDATLLGGEDPTNLVDRAAEALGGLDILIVSAPPVRSKPVLEMTQEELRSITDSELVVPALQMQAAAKLMSAQKYGRIIAFASMSGKAGVHHLVAPYAAAKGGMLTFMRVLAAETAGDGVTVNGIATALFEPQTATMPPEKQARLRAQIPVGRFGYSEEAAHAVLFLASPLAGYVTGECLNLSGGRFMD